MTKDEILSRLLSDISDEFDKDVGSFFMMWQSRHRRNLKRHTYGLPKILGFLVRHEPFSFFVLPVGIFERTRCLVTFAISISIVLVLFSYLRTIRLKVSNRGITANGFRKSKKYCDLFRFLNLFCVYFYRNGTILSSLFFAQKFICIF